MNSKEGCGWVCLIIYDLCIIRYKEGCGWVCLLIYDLCIIRYEQQGGLWLGVSARHATGTWLRPGEVYCGGPEPGLLPGTL